MVHLRVQDVVNPALLPFQFGWLTPVIRTTKVQKRASNVLKLAQENAKLQEELKAMNERLEAAQRRQEELGKKLQNRSAS